MSLMALQKSRRLKASPSVQYPWRCENLITGALDGDPQRECTKCLFAFAMVILDGGEKVSEWDGYLFGAPFVNINPLLPVEICRGRRETVFTISGLASVCSSQEVLWWRHRHECNRTSKS